MLPRLPKNKSGIIRSLNKSKFAIQSKMHVNYARFFDWFKYQTVKVPLWVLMHLSKSANISLVEMERNIVSYKLTNSPARVAVREPILPVKLTPEFVSLTAHFCFDGSLPKDGKGSYYSQKNIEQVNNFIEKTKNCFGGVPAKIRLDGKKVYSIRLPRIIGEACRHICGFETFDSLRTVIPERIKESGSDFKAAFLVSAIVDEGCVGTEYIQLMLKNKKMIEDLREICSDLDCDCTEPRGRKGYKNFSYFYIKSVVKLWENITGLTKRYPSISFGFKESKFRYVISSRGFAKPEHNARTAAERKKIILNNLKESKTSFELANTLKIPARSVRRHLGSLLESGKIERTKIKQTYFYHFPHCFNAILSSE